MIFLFIFFANLSSIGYNACLKLISGGGSMVGAIAGSTQREPLVVGKPSTFMMDYLASKYDLKMLNCIHILHFSFSAPLYLSRLDRICSLTSHSWNLCLKIFWSIICCILALFTWSWCFFPFFFPYLRAQTFRVYVQCWMQPCILIWQNLERIQ